MQLHESLREESDAMSSAASSGGTHFNPHSREGSDAAAMKKLAAQGYISIHAPVKGAT